MKKEFFDKPKNIVENWPGELDMFAWEEFVTAIPTPIFIATSYKSNGKGNACLQSWATFVSEKDEYMCVLAAVNRNGHFYQTLSETGVCVLNFVSENYYDRCMESIHNNGFEDDEIAMSGFTPEPAKTINAPRIAEAFLNIECELAWQRELVDGSDCITIALRKKHIAMNDEYYNETKTGRYGKTGYIYNIHSPRNPETGETMPDSLGVIEILKTQLP